MNRLVVTGRKPTPKRRFRINPIAINAYLRDGNVSKMNTWFPIMQAAGIKYVRMEAVMAELQPTQGVFDYAKYDTIVNLAASYGIEIIMLLVQYGMPAWLGNPTSFYAPTPAQYKTWCQNVASHFKGRVSLFELGNEPNFTFFWPPYPNYIDYTNLLKAGYTGIQTGNPNALVVSAGLGSVATSDGNGIATTTFWNGMLSQGAKDYYDFPAIHPYAQPPSNTDYNTVLANIDALRAIQLSYGDTKPMMITELGWTTYATGIPLATQAAHITSFFNDIMFGNYQYIELFAMYNFQNTGTNTADPEQNYGILYNDLSHKPSFDSYVTAKNNFDNTFVEVPLLQ